MNKAEKAKAEARRAAIVEALDSISAIDLLRLHEALQAVRQGNRTAIKDLTDRIRQETEELERALLAGYRPEEFKQMLAEGLEVTGGDE